MKDFESIIGEGLLAIGQQMSVDSEFWFPKSHTSDEVAQMHYVLGLGGEGGEVLAELTEQLIGSMISAKIGRLVDTFKKINRGDDPSALQNRIDDEMADVFIYLVLLAHVRGKNLVTLWLGKRGHNVNRWGLPPVAGVLAVTNTEQPSKHDPLDPTDYSADPPSRPLATGGIVSGEVLAMVGESPPHTFGLVKPGLEGLNPTPERIIAALRSDDEDIELRAVADGTTTWYPAPPDSEMRNTAHWKLPLDLLAADGGLVPYVRIVAAAPSPGQLGDKAVQRLLDGAHELLTAMEEESATIESAINSGHQFEPGLLTKLRRTRDALELVFPDGAG